MARRARTRYPLESFDPRFKDILLRGALERVEITFPTKNKAWAFLFRLNTYRSRVKKEHGMEAAAALYRCKIHRPDDPNVVVLEPHDIEFDAAFEQVGLASTGPEPTQDEDPFQSLDDLFLPGEGERK